MTSYTKSLGINKIVKVTMVPSILFLNPYLGTTHILKNYAQLLSNFPQVFMKYATLIDSILQIALAIF